MFPILDACANTYGYSKNAGNNDALQGSLIICKTVMALQVGDAARDAMDKCMADKGYEKKVDTYRL